MILGINIDMVAPQVNFFSQWYHNMLELILGLKVNLIND